MALDKNSIANVATAVFDNGRRGAPRPGCDCVQCFGYCLIDGDDAFRMQAERRAPRREADELDFDA